MKFKCTFFFLIAAVLATTAQTKISSDSLQNELTLHFKIYPPEAQRYSSVTTFGEAKTSFDKAQMDKELLLFEGIKKSELIHHPSMDILDLCHNISIYNPEKGNEFLSLLNVPLEDPELLVPFYMQIIFAGQFGEQLMLKNLNSSDPYWQRDCAGYLGSFAIFESSLPTIEKHILATKDPEVQQDLIGALTFISSLKSIPIIKKITETTKNDTTQSKAIFAYTELSGYDGLKYIEKIEPVGEESTREQKASIKWIKEETNAKNKYGVVVKSDANFILRFSTVRSPAMIWLEKEKLLDTAKALHPIPFTPAQKSELIKLLIESKGFGLEAVKGQLFLSLRKSDMPALLELRKSCVYSPNTFSFGRLSTVGMFIRYLRRTT
ncbi:MAG TPA: hypothetical protein VFF27_18700 [Bacteroidia bacterium]|jgi:hypothetical protein|nr:hypothetical protein [Bacteroidia bacterium]